jgi:hypothetical protein
MSFRVLAATAAVLSIVGNSSLASGPGAALAFAEGKVLVNGGNGYLAAQAGMALEAGDAVFVGNDAKATISYPACAVVLQPGTVYRVAKEAQCEGSQAGLDGGEAIISPAFGSDGSFNAGGLAAAGGVLLLGGGVIFLALNYQAPDKAVSQEIAP